MIFTFFSVSLYIKNMERTQGILRNNKNTTIQQNTSVFLETLGAGVDHAMEGCGGGTEVWWLYRRAVNDAAPSVQHLHVASPRYQLLHRHVPTTSPITIFRLHLL